MKIAIPKERHPGETRVAASPEVVKKLVGLGFEVVVEKSAGEGASFSDDAFKEAGASIAKDAAATLEPWTNSNDPGTFSSSMSLGRAPSA